MKDLPLIPSICYSPSDEPDHRLHLALQYGDVEQARVALYGTNTDEETAALSSSELSGKFSPASVITPLHFNSPEEINVALVNSLSGLASYNKLKLIDDSSLNQHSAEWLLEQRLKIIDMAAQVAGVNFATPFAQNNSEPPSAEANSTSLDLFCLSDPQGGMHFHPEIRDRILIHAIVHNANNREEWAPKLEEIFKHTEGLEPTRESDDELRAETAEVIEKTIQSVANRLHNPQSQIERQASNGLSPTQKNFWSSNAKIDLSAMPYMSDVRRVIVTAQRTIDGDEFDKFFSPESPFGRAFTEHLRGQTLADSAINRAKSGSGGASPESDNGPHNDTI